MAHTCFNSAVVEAALSFLREQGFRVREEEFGVVRRWFHAYGYHQCMLSPSLLICLTTQVGVTKSVLFAPSVSRKIHGKNLLNTSTNTRPTRTTRVSNLGWLLLNALGAQFVLPATASVNSTSARGRVGALKPAVLPCNRLRQLTHSQRSDPRQLASFQSGWRFFPRPFLLLNEFHSSVACW